MSHTGRSPLVLTSQATCLRKALSSAVLASLLTAPPSATEANDGAGGDPEPTVSRTADRSSPDAQHPLVERFLARKDEPVRQFRARRLLRSEGLGREAAMEVLVELDPEDGFRWEVLHEEGSKIMRNRGFRTLLEKEADAYAAGDVSRSSLTGDNYRLSLAEVGADGLVRLRAEPRRKERTLIDGTFTVTADDADLLSVEGRLAKGPSFWTPRVEIVRRYRRIRGHRVLVRMESTAYVRLLGEVEMVVDYDYLMIDGEEIPTGSTSPGDDSASLELPWRSHPPSLGGRERSDRASGEGRCPPDERPQGRHQASQEG